MSSGTSSPNRRDFLRTLALAGTGLPWARRVGADGLPLSEGRTFQLDNGVFKVGFEAQTGRLEIWRHTGEPLLMGGVVRVRRASGLRASDAPGYGHTVETGSAQDGAGGESDYLVVRSRDEEHGLDLEWRVDLLEGSRAVVLEAVCRNRSGLPVVVESLEPLCAIREQGGAFYWPGATRLLTNGAMYYDPGTLHDFEQVQEETRRSWWNVGVFSGYERESVVCGFLDNQGALGQVTARREAGIALSLTAEAVLAKGFELRPGQTIRSGRFLIQLGEDPYEALEVYASELGRRHGARVHSVVNGWCNWFYTYEHITEEEVLRNAEVAARLLKPVGLEYVQVDEGYQRAHGDWEGNDRFPHGMQWLADRIRALGLKPGIWLAPYVISETTEVFQKHPEWLLRHEDGSLKRVGPWPSEDSDWARNERPKRYGLDVTHPGAAYWLSQLFATIGRKWGYEMIKIDFVDWSLLSAHRYHDPTVSRALAYRAGFEILRQAVGPQCHLQDCGPAPVTVGLADSMRIELDQNYGYRRNAWRQYLGPSTSSAAAAAKRYYFHKRCWINDADHLCLNLLSRTQAEAATTLIALTGGNVISGDRLTELDEVRLEILRKAFPASGEAARPADLLDSDRPTVFSLKLSRPWGDWVVVGIFNPDLETSSERVVSLKRLGLDPGVAWLAYDFWQESFLGEVRGELRVTVPPGGVVLLSVRQQRGIPQVLSTDRHILQGAVELENVAWDPEARALCGVSLGPAGSAHHLAIYLPEARPWRQGGHVLFRDFPGYTMRVVDDHLLRMRVRFDQADRVAWRVGLSDLEAHG